MDEKRGLFRVNYFDPAGNPKTSFVVAFTDVEAAQFLGVVDSSGVQITRDRYPVEVAGLDATHASIPPIPVEKAAFDLPKSVSRSEFEALQATLNALTEQMKLKNTPVSPEPPQPISVEPTHVQPDQPAKE